MIIATAGHIDHGKTSLVRALTGVDTDRLPEEKARGMTIDLGFAYADVEGGGRLGFVDVPGHERFIKNMLAGVGAIDLALLVVAVDDGPMPQTEEHLAILDLLGIREAAVALTKTDRAAPERVAEVEELVELLLTDTSLEGAPCFPTSAESGEGIVELRHHLDTRAGEIAARPASGNFRLAVDRSFTVAGAGMVVTGSVFSGRVEAGDQLRLSPKGRALRVRGLRAQNRESAEGLAGERVALNIAGPEVDREAVTRGEWVVAPGMDAPTRRLDARIRILPGERRPFRHWTPVHVHLAASDVTGRVALLEGRSLAPGECGLAQVVLDRSIGAVVGDRLVLRDQAAQRTLGGGPVIDPVSPQRGRARPERVALLGQIDPRDPAAALGAQLAAHPGGLHLGAFQRAWNLTEAEAGALYAAEDLRRIEVGGETTGFRSEDWETLGRDVVEALRRWHERKPESVGASELELRRTLSRGLSEPVLAVVLAELIEAGEVGRRGTYLRLASHRPQPTAREAELWKRIQPILEAGELRPPRVREIADELKLGLNGLENFLGRAQQLGLALRVTDNRSFLPETVLELAEIAENLAEKADEGLFEAKEFRDQTGIGRNLTIEVLEYFDRTGFTRRTQAGRRIQRPAAEVFGIEK